MKIATVSQMKILDHTALDAFGISNALLMENAGISTYNVLQDKIGVGNKTILVFCGAGNNGGDGLVIARKIHSNGGKVKVFLLGDPEKYTGAAELNLKITYRLPIETQRLRSTDGLALELAHCHGVVDSIFGTGLTRNVGDLYADVIDLMNNSGKPIISLDIPSGINGNTGLVMGIAVKATYTVTLGLPKLGNLFYPGYDHCGNLYVSHITFPPSLYDRDDIAVEINAPYKLPKRNRDGHKGDFGETLFIAGASGYFGAPYFAAFSFLKAGGGYSRLATPASVISLTAAKGSEIVFFPMSETPSGGISRANEKVLLDLSEKMDMVVLGPGLSLEKETQRLARKLAASINKPLLIDGDGITAISGHPDIIRHRNAETILTPHMGEMSRIAGVSTEEINTRRIEILQEVAASLNAIIVLKGAHSLIGTPNQQVFVNLTGNSGMATAGSGDVLTGTIAAMFGLGLSVEAAVRNGVFIHGLAGDMAVDDKGEDGITAQNILEYLPRALKKFREIYHTDFAAHYTGIPVV